MDMLIKNEELTDWLKEQPQVVAPLLQGYKEAISDMSSDLLIDPRSSKNIHIVNPEFETEQKYFMGMEPLPERHQLIISCLYVFPTFRGMGYGKHLIDFAKNLVQDQGFIQVAVEKESIDRLDLFYKNLGFKTTEDIFTNLIGKSYKDYFWSGKEIELTRIGDSIAVKPL